MSADSFQLRITSDTRRMDAYIKGVGSDKVTFTAKMFDNGSVHGLNDGRVSKLDIRKDGRIIVNFDRGWDVKPAVPEHQSIYNAVMAKLNSLDKVHDMDGQPPKTLTEKLAAAKEKAAQREFEVTITETLQKKVVVTAKDQAEAEQMVNDAWNNCEYILDADHFVGASFDASPVTREHSRGAER